MSKRLPALLAAMLLAGAGCPVQVTVEPAAAPPSAAAVVPAGSGTLKVDERSVSSTRFLVFRQARPNVRFTLTRPDADDPGIALAVAGTYTSPADAPEGWIVLDGQIIQDKERQGWDGAVTFDDGGIAITQTDRGRQLTRATLKDVAAAGASLMQAHLLVFRGKAQPFKEQPATFRRALAKTKEGDVIVESRDPIDLDTFAADLVALGAFDAVNLDMGSWSEGWYRGEDGRRVTLGFPNENTARQSNWIMFRSE